MTKFRHRKPRRIETSRQSRGTMKRNTHLFIVWCLEALKATSTELFPEPCMIVPSFPAVIDRNETLAV